MPHYYTSNTMEKPSKKDRLIEKIKHCEIIKEAMDISISEYKLQLERELDG